MAVGLGDAHLLARTHGLHLVVRSRLALAAAHRNQCARAVFVDVDAILAGAQQGERHLRRVDLKAFLIAEPAQAHAQGAGGNLHLRHGIAQVDESEISAAVQAQRGRPRADFGPRSGLGPQLVAGRERPVEGGGHPILDAGRLERHHPVNETESGGAARWIIGRRLVRRSLIGCIWRRSLRERQRRGASGYRYERE